jgi:predicted dehydrogenase
MNTLPRRRFIRRTAIAAVAFPFVSTAVTRALAQAAERKIGFALCGLGSLSTNQLAPALQKTKNCRLAGIITGTPAKAERWKAKYNIPEGNIFNYDNMDRLAGNPDIDVVYVVTPNALHMDSTLKAAAAGKHVLSEKPMEVTPERCQKMIDACKAAKRMLAIGYRCHFEPNHLECIRLAREKTFGSPRIVEATFDIQLGPNGSQWRLKKDLAGGGCLMDVGIYALQATRYITGEEPATVSGMVTQTDPVRFKEVEETITWLERFPGGAVAHCSASYNTNVTSRLTVTAQRGSFTLEPAFLYDGNRGRRSDGQEIRMEPVDQFAAEMDDFANCILTGQATRVPGEEGLRDVKIMMSIYESVRSGKTVEPA